VVSGVWVLLWLQASFVTILMLCWVFWQVQEGPSGHMVQRVTMPQLHHQEPMF
jgi:hypothetical protein